MNDVIPNFLKGIKIMYDMFVVKGLPGKNRK